MIQISDVSGKAVFLLYFFNKLTNWMIEDRLMLNDDKTELMVIGTSTITRFSKYKF